MTSILHPGDLAPRILSGLSFVALLASVVFPATAEPSTRSGAPQVPIGVVTRGLNSDPQVLGLDQAELVLERTVDYLHSRFLTIYSGDLSTMEALGPVTSPSPGDRWLSRQLGTVLLGLAEDGSPTILTPSYRILPPEPGGTLPGFFEDLTRPPGWRGQISPRHLEIPEIQGEARAYLATGRHPSAAMRHDTTITGRWLHYSVPLFSFDPETQDYRRLIGREPIRDPITRNLARIANVVLVQDRLDAAGRPVEVFTGGRRVPGHTATEGAVFVGEGGEPIPLSPGLTWIYVESRDTPRPEPRPRARRTSASHPRPAGSDRTRTPSVDGG